MARVKGMHKILYWKDAAISPLNKQSVARPIPQPGQGILVINLKAQSVMCWWLLVASIKINAKYPPTIAEIESRYLTEKLLLNLYSNLSKFPII